MDAPLTFMIHQLFSHCSQSISLCRLDLGKDPCGLSFQHPFHGYLHGLGVRRKVIKTTIINTLYALLLVPLPHSPTTVILFTKCAGILTLFKLLELVSAPLFNPSNAKANCIQSSRVQRFLKNI